MTYWNTSVSNPIIEATQLKTEGCSRPRNPYRTTPLYANSWKVNGQRCNRVAGKRCVRESKATEHRRETLHDA